MTITWLCLSTPARCVETNKRGSVQLTPSRHKYNNTLLLTPLKLAIGLRCHQLSVYFSTRFPQRVSDNDFPSSGCSHVNHPSLHALAITLLAIRSSSNPVRNNAWPCGAVLNLSKSTLASTERAFVYVIPMSIRCMELMTSHSWVIEVATLDGIPVTWWLRFAADNCLVHHWQCLHLTAHFLEEIKHRLI